MHSTFTFTSPQDPGEHAPMELHCAARWRACYQQVVTYPISSRENLMPHWRGPRESMMLTAKPPRLRS
jgi:hypothetical protein